MMNGSSRGYVSGRITLTTSWNASGRYGPAKDASIKKLPISISKDLERVVTMYLDYAENQASRQIPMKMADWVQKLDAFLQFNEYQILSDAGKVSHEVAKQLAEEEYEKFRVVQDREFESDFDKEVKKMLGSKKRKTKENS